MFIQADRNNSGCNVVNFAIAAGNNDQDEADKARLSLFSCTEFMAKALL